MRRIDYGKIKKCQGRLLAGSPGLCIILVVLIHSANGLDYFGHPGMDWNYYFWIVERQIINVPVAIFIFLSGYFTPVSRIRENPKVYLRDRLVRLVPSYIIWTAFYTVLSVVHFKKSHQPVGFGLLLQYIFLGKSAVPFYFIIVLIQLTLLTPLLMKCIERAALHKLMFAVTPVYLIFLYFYQIRYNTLLSSSQTFFPAWFIFYYLGMSLKIKGKPKIQIKNPVFWSACFVLTALGLSLLESFVLLRFNITSLFIVSQIKLSSFLYAISMICFLSAIKPSKPGSTGKLLTYLGNCSFGIFYVHMVMLTNVANKITFSVPALPLVQLFRVTLAIILSVVVIQVVKKLFPDKISRICFGF